MDYSDLSLQKHQQLKGKIGIENKAALDTKEAMSTFYTPGVAAVSSHLATYPEQVGDYTWVHNNVAVVSDGSAVLGLGNIGPVAALPVMEGKAMLFKHFADIDAVPVVLDVHSADDIVAAVKAIAPSFGGINLEDIAAPICFEVEERLKAELDIPVFHDDQHGTAVVVLAGLINALKVTGRSGELLKIVVAGVGAAGTATIKLLHRMWPQAQIVAVDSRGIISLDRADLNSSKRDLLQIVDGTQSGDLATAMQNADVFTWVSKPSTVDTTMIQSMAKQPIVFALSNPMPEIFPDQAKAAGAAVVATGRSDFANQVNNSLAFPGIFRGALDNKLKRITEEHKLAAAMALAALVVNADADMIVPGPFTTGLVEAVAKAVS